MRFLLDSADRTLLQLALEGFPIVGVTTNPTLLAREHDDWRESLAAIRAMIGEDRELHAQVISPEAATMVAEARVLADVAGPSTYVKVPMTREGLKAAKVMVEAGRHVTATAVFSIEQALLAARVGASYVAPYVNRLDEAGRSGSELVAGIATAFTAHGINTKILAASFKRAEQVRDCALAGAYEATVSWEVLIALVEHPLTAAAVDEFTRAWLDRYGTTSLRP
jgi:fructose-6-phosphate aldolase 2